MQVGDPTLVTPVVIPPEAPAVQPRVRPVGDDSATSRDRSDTSSGDRSTAFKSALDATATTNATTNAANQTASFEKSQDVATVIRPGRRPTRQLELSGADSVDLYEAAQNLGAVVTPKPATTTSAQPSGPRPTPKQSRAATQQYAKSFFSVGGTFAARGDSLELTT